MNTVKIVGMVLLVAGFVLLVLSLTANALGIGNPDVFGRNQIFGAVAGAIAAVAGLVLTLRKRS